MTSLDVLVCVKRVPDSTSEIVLTEDGQAVDGRFAGFTTSPHEECAVELAVQAASATDGSATVLTLGDADAIEQLRAALAVGCTAATHVVADAQQFGPADVAREIAVVVRAHEAEGRPHDLVLLGNDAADTGDFQVGIRLAYALGRPVVTGVSKVAVSEVDGALVVTASGDGPDGYETYRVPLPAVVSVLEGGVEPRYPTVPGRMKAKKVVIEELAPSQLPAGPARVRWSLPPAAPSDVQVLGTGPEAAPAVVDLLEKLGVLAR
jgi:electron transfer flavoprotein beta subunit